MITIYIYIFFFFGGGGEGGGHFGGEASTPQIPYVEPCWRAWYNGSYTVMAKPILSEL